MASVEITVEKRVATIVLNRPEAMNALSRALRAELAAAMRGLPATKASARSCSPGG